MDADVIVATVTDNELIELANSLAAENDATADKTLFGKLSKHLAPRTFVNVGSHSLEWASTEYNAKKDKVSMVGFVIELQWGVADPSGRRSIAIHTSEAFLINDSISWEKEHDQARKAFLDGIEAVDPNARVTQRAGEQ